MTQKEKIYLLLIVIIFLTSAFASLNNYLMYTPDSARYISWANSLANFDGFVDTTGPEPERYVVHAPLYSIILSPIALIFPNNIIALKAATAVLGAIVIFLLFYLSRDSQAQTAAGVTTTLFAFHPFMIVFSTQALSEVIFAAGLLSLFMYVKQFHQISEDKKYSIYFLAASLMVCVFSREAGIVLVPLVAGWLTVKKKYTDAVLIIVIFGVLYGGWYVRNEIFVANSEHPALRNSQLFFSNVLKHPDASFAEELMLRWKASAAYYGKTIMSVLFTSLYPTFDTLHENPLLTQTNLYNPAYKFAAKIVGNWHLLFIAGGMTLILWGIVADIKKKTTDSLFPVVFFAAYMALICSYPVYDFRFLFPVVILFFLWVHSAIVDIKQRFGSVLYYCALAVTLLFSIPNIVWSINYLVTHNTIAQQSLQKFTETNISDSVKTDDRIIEPLSLVGEWLTLHQDSSSVIITRFKQLALLAPSQKVLIPDPFSTVEDFERKIRDYNVRYIVTSIDNIRWQEFELQMAINTHYSYERVFTAGWVVVFEVVPKKQGQSIVAFYNPLIKDIADGNFSRAEKFFELNKSIVPGHPGLTFLHMVTKECLGKLDTAEIISRAFNSMTQGLGYTVYAGYHNTIIERRRELERTTDNSQRSDILMTIGFNYWQLGMYTFARQYAAQSLQFDSTYVLAYVYNILYALQCGDTLAASVFMDKFSRAYPHEEITDRFNLLMNRVHALRFVQDVKERSYVMSQISDAFDKVGLYEYSIDVLHRALDIDPVNIPVLQKLSELYQQTRKNYSALLILNRLQKVIPGDSSVSERMNRIREDLGL